MHRHQSYIVRIQVNNPIGWGAMAVLVPNHLMIVWFGPLVVRTTPNSEQSSRIAGNRSIRTRQHQEVPFHITAPTMCIRRVEKRKSLIWYCTSEYALHDPWGSVRERGTFHSPIGRRAGFIRWCYAGFSPYLAEKFHRPVTWCRKIALQPYCLRHTKSYWHLTLLLACAGSISDSVSCSESILNACR